MRAPVLLIALLPGLASAEPAPPLSGYGFMAPATQELQDDDFLNPAFFTVENGAALWDADWPGAAGEARSCRSCHGDPASLAGVSARYPQIEDGRPVNLELRIIAEITDRMGAPEPAYDSPEILALTALVALQSRGMPVTPAIGPEAEAWAARGRAEYTLRRGQLNLSCANCHDERWGQKLRGDTISQGQSNAWPVFRLVWDEVAPLHRIFSWCMEAVRSEPYAYGSEEYLALELYLAARGAGLAVESPGVRR